MPRGPLTPRARLLLPVALLGLVALSLHRMGDVSGTRQRAAPSLSRLPSSGAPLTTLAGESMGTTYSVKLLLPVALTPQQVHAAVKSALDAVDASMSTYRPSSELSRFNASSSTEPVAISDELRAVVEVALLVGKASGGALDITVGPLVDAWGFGPTEPTPPDDAELARLRERVGMDKLGLDDRGLRKARADVRCDLSAVAKGHAVDRVARALADLGVRHYLVEVGGELSARGRRPDGQPWRVAIEQPTPGRRSIERVLAIDSGGLATSGDYRNYYEKDGKRIAHLIDPRSGKPIEHGLASVSVVHPRVAVADAWATALSVLGPEQGPKVAERENLPALFLVRQPDGGFRSIVTSAFARTFPE